MSYRRILLFVVVITGSLFIMPATAALDSRADKSYPVAQAEYDTGSITQTLKLTPDTPGSVQVTTSADLPLAVTEFELYINEAAEQVNTDGFRQTTARDPVDGFRKYEWDGTDSPSITYNLDVNTTDSKGKYETVDGGEWAIIETPQIPYSWSANEDVELVRNHRVAGPGISKDGFTFLGEHTIKSVSENDQRFRLVIPEAADLTESPDAILDNIAYASNQLQVGSRDSDVVMIAAPTSDKIQWSHGGTAHDSIFWVQADAKLDTPGNTWVHEYIHTRQSFVPTEDFDWLIEGSAEYYAALFTLQQEQIGFEQFQRHLTVNGPRESSKILTKTKYAAPAQYSKGGLVVARTDQRIRLATNGSSSLATIFNRLNSEDEPISNGDFIRYVYLYGNEDLESDVRAATTTSESMAMWDKQDHTRAFGEEPHESESANTAKTDQDSNSADSDSFLSFISSLVAVNGVVYIMFRIRNNKN